MSDIRSANISIQGTAATRARSRLAHLVSLVGLGLLAAFLLIICAEFPGASHEARATMGRGVVDYRLEEPAVDPAKIPGIVAEMGSGRLGATWTRVLVHWATAQPTAPGSLSAGDTDGDGYEDAYLARLDTVVAALHAEGIRIIMTAIDVPEWASDSRYWTEEGYDPDVVMRINDLDVRGAFRTLAKRLGARYAGRADHFEVWNEPNLGSGIYPQIVGKKVVGPAVYFQMLKAFYAGAKQGNRRAVVIAGGTSRRGANDERSTSPQWFAQYLKKQRADRWFDAYSHHPYTPPGSPPAPNMPPNMPKRAVTLGNLEVLLDLFPRKPFYLTEFGYSTGTSDLFCVWVSATDQARYLRQAYAMMARRPQIKALLWFLVTDYQPDLRAPEVGIFSGLVEPDGVTRKPAWYAFAGHNSIALAAPGTAPAGSAFTVSGSLSTRLGPLTGARVTLQSRRPSARVWTTVAAATTLGGGAYSFSVTQTRTKLYRSVWSGVCESRRTTVWTP